MAETPSDTPATEADDLALWRARVRDANINDTSLLATDYLNHFNEVVMLIEMVADMPECLDDVRDWRPKSYQDHFADSSFSDKDLAIDAYDHAPAEFRDRLELTVDQINRLVALSIERLDAGARRRRAGGIEHLRLARLARSPAPGRGRRRDDQRRHADHRSGRHRRHVR